jgi:hypothetical protein
MSVLEVTRFFSQMDSVTMVVLVPSFHFAALVPTAPIVAPDALEGVRLPQRLCHLRHLPLLEPVHHPARSALSLL